MPSSVASLSGGVLIVGAAIPLGVMLTVWEFMISLIVIGVCIAVISVLSILGLVEEAKKNN
jgi:hypothetical protein